MKNYYAITMQVKFAVLAESEEEAERVAAEILPDETDFPVRASVDIEAYCTPNQSEDLKRTAVNYE